MINQNIIKSIVFFLFNNKKIYKLNKVEIGNPQFQMLHVQPTKHHLPLFIQNHIKQNDYFLIKDNQMRLVRQIFDQMTFAIFQKQESFLIVLIKKFCMEIINRKLSFPLLEEIFYLLKQSQADIKIYKEHFSQLESVMFSHDQLLPQHFVPTLQQQQENANIFHCNIANSQTFDSLNMQEKSHDPPKETINHNNVKSLSFDIDCFSEDSKHNFVSFDDKYFCSEYLTTSQDEREFTSKSTILKQFKQQMQTKLKIHPNVSDFSFNLQSVDIEKQLLDWKRTKRSILQQPTLRKALSPNDIDASMLMQKMKQNHYRQKIKSTIVRKRLSTKHFIQ